MEKKEKNYKLGLALSGGGARGIAHIGVLKALEDNAIIPDCLAGASAGAVVGALYAAGKTPEEILKFVAEKSASLYQIYKMSFPKIGLTKLTYLKKQLSPQFEEDDFSILKKPLYIAISNLNSGELELRNKGTLVDIIVASSCIPILFQPIDMDGMKYVDGGMLMNLPAEPLYPICEKVIGVNVIPHFKVPNKSISNVLNIAMRCFELSILANTENQALMCDLIIEPAELHHYDIFGFKKYQEIYDIGYKAAMARMDAIKRLLDHEQRTKNSLILQ